jgi:hypothetical protein
MSEKAAETSDNAAPSAAGDPPNALATRAASMPVRSIYESSYIEALRHKWIASEKAGQDLGEEAICEWLDRHWKGWCRERWLEHLQGEVCWAEFDADKLGSINRDFHGDGELLRRVTELIRAGWENLDIIIWAAENALDVREVIDILIIADINCPTLDHPLSFENRVA